MDYLQRFALCGDYAFGRKSGTPEGSLKPALEFTALPLRRLSDTVLEGPECFVPLSLMEHEEADRFFMLPFAPMGVRPTPDALKPLENYLISGPMHAVNYWEVHRAMRQIHAVRKHIIANGPPEAARVTTRALLNSLLAQYPHARWLLSQSRHPYFVAPICEDPPQRWLCGTEHGFTAPLPRRPDILHAASAEEFEWTFIEQITRFSYIQLRLSSKTLPDEALRRDGAAFRKNRTDIMEKASQTCGEFAQTVEAKITPLLEQAQPSYDDAPENVHHDADVIAALHVLRKRLEALISPSPDEIYASASPAVDALTLFAPNLTAAYAQGFLPALRHAMEQAGLPTKKIPA